MARPSRAVSLVFQTATPIWGRCWCLPAGRLCLRRWGERLAVERPRPGRAMPLYPPRPGRVHAAGPEMKAIACRTRRMPPTRHRQCCIAYSAPADAQARLRDSGAENLASPETSVASPVALSPHFQVCRLMIALPPLYHAAILRIAVGNAHWLRVSATSRWRAWHRYPRQGTGAKDSKPNGELIVFWAANSGDSGAQKRSK